MTRVVLDTDLAGYPANNFVGYPAEYPAWPDTGYPVGYPANSKYRTF